MRVSSYVAYVLVSVLWLILQLSLTRYTQYSGVPLLVMLVIIISIIIASYKPAYSNYLFIINTALVIYVGFTIPTALSTAYSTLVVAGIITYLLLTGLIKPIPLLVSLPIIYVSYIISRALNKLGVVKEAATMINNAGLAGGLFTTVMVWYLSLFLVSMAIVLIIILLAKE